MKKLTAKQRRILEFIIEFLKMEQMAPSVYEIADELSVKTSTVFVHLFALQKKGYIMRSRKARSIKVIKKLH